MWTEEKDKAFRAETERRFRSRTPPVRIDDALVESRVTRGEMRTWAKNVLGEMPPEVDFDWITAHAKWYRKMSRRVIKETGSKA